MPNSGLSLGPDWDAAVWNASPPYRFLKNLSQLDDNESNNLCCVSGNQHWLCEPNWWRFVQSAGTGLRGEDSIKPPPGLTSANPGSASTTPTHQGVSSSFDSKGLRHDNTQQSYTNGGKGWWNFMRCFQFILDISFRLASKNWFNLENKETRWKASFLLPEILSKDSINQMNQPISGYNSVFNHWQNTKNLFGNCLEILFPHWNVRFLPREVENRITAQTHMAKTIHIYCKNQF